MSFTSQVFSSTVTHKEPSSRRASEDELQKNAQMSVDDLLQKVAKLEEVFQNFIDADIEKKSQYLSPKKLAAWKATEIKKLDDQFLGELESVWLLKKMGYIDQWNSIRGICSFLNERYLSYASRAFDKIKSLESSSKIA